MFEHEKLHRAARSFRQDTSGDGDGGDGYAVASICEVQVDWLGERVGREVEALAGGDEAPVGARVDFDHGLQGAPGGVLERYGQQEGRAPLLRRMADCVKTLGGRGAATRELLRFLTCFAIGP